MFSTVVVPDTAQTNLSPISYFFYRSLIRSYTLCFVRSYTLILVRFYTLFLVRSYILFWSVPTLSFGSVSYTLSYPLTYIAAAAADTATLLYIARFFYLDTIFFQEWPLTCSLQLASSNLLLLQFASTFMSLLQVVSSNLLFSPMVNRRTRSRALALSDLQVHNTSSHR